MSKIFMSYRRADSMAVSGRIYDRLVQHFGRQSVFKDVDDIPPGEDFAQYIQCTLRASSVHLVIIGPHWLDAVTAEGQPRLASPGDFVHTEVETALRMGLAIIPVLVDGAVMPAADRLPADLRRLAHINALRGVTIPTSDTTCKAWSRLSSASPPSLLPRRARQRPLPPPAPGPRPAACRARAGTSAVGSQPPRPRRSSCSRLCRRSCSTAHRWQWQHPWRWGRAEHQHGDPVHERGHGIALRHRRRLPDHARSADGDAGWAAAIGNDRAKSPYPAHLRRLRPGGAGDGAEDHDRRHAAEHGLDV